MVLVGWPLHASSRGGDCWHKALCLEARLYLLLERRRFLNHCGNFFGVREHDDMAGRKNRC